MSVIEPEGQYLNERGSRQKESSNQIPTSENWVGVQQSASSLLLPMQCSIKCTSENLKRTALSLVPN